MVILAAILIILVFLCWAVYFYNVVPRSQGRSKKGRFGKKRRMRRTTVKEGIMSLLNEETVLKIKSLPPEEQQQVLDGQPGSCLKEPVRIVLICRPTIRLMIRVNLTLIVDTSAKILAATNLNKSWEPTIESAFYQTRSSNRTFNRPAG